MKRSGQIGVSASGSVAGLHASKEKGASKAEKSPKKLDKMRSNHKNDWKINDLESVANSLGINVRPPNSGSHYVFSSPLLEGHLTVPAKRPIKPPYIKSFVAMCDAHLEYQTKGEDNGKSV